VQRPAKKRIKSKSHASCETSNKHSHVTVQPLDILSHGHLQLASTGLCSYSRPSVT
jgi:hypothetical protein